MRINIKERIETFFRQRRDLVWTTRDKRKIPVYLLEDDHLLNIERALRRGRCTDGCPLKTRPRMQQRLAEEISKRGLRRRE